MKLILFSLMISSNLWALDSNEELRFKFNEVENPQIVTIDRGLEDGIKRGDHIKFYKDGDFVARGVALSAEMQTSKFLVYRVMGTIKEKQEGMELVAINRSQIPDYIQDKLQKLNQKDEE